MQAILRKTPVDASKTEFAVQIGGAADHIVKYAHEHQADLIIMGAHRGAAAASHAPWSVAHQVVKNASAPVLMIRNQK
jgi:nucleotide-binding universal stress UspA family protein